MATPAFTPTAGPKLAPALEIKKREEETATTASKEIPAITELQARHVQDVLKYHSDEAPIFEEILNQIYLPMTSDEPVEALRSFLDSKREAIIKMGIEEFARQNSFMKDYDSSILEKEKMGDQDAINEFIDGIFKFYYMHALLMAIRLDHPMTVLMGLCDEGIFEDKYPLALIACEFATLNNLLSLLAIFKGYQLKYSPNIYCPLIFTASMWIAKCDRKDILKDYLKTNRSLSKSSITYLNCFFAATYGGAISTMDYLLSLDKTLITQVDEGSGVNAFMVAAFSGNIASLKYLAQKAKETMDVEIWKSVTKENENVFMYAIGGGNLDVLEFMRKEYNEHFWRETTPDGINAFMVAVRTNQPQCMEYLLKLDPDFALKTDKEGNNAFLAANNNTDVNTIRFLKKLDPTLINSRNKNGENALHLAAKARWSNYSYLLISEGVNLGMVTNTGETERDIFADHLPSSLATLFTAIDQAFDAVQKGNSDQFEPMKKILEDNYLSSRRNQAYSIPFPINYRDKAGKTLLHYACDKMGIVYASVLLHDQNVKNALLLMEKGIGRDIKDNQGNTYLQEVYKFENWGLLAEAYKQLSAKIVQEEALSDQEKEAKAKSLHQEFAVIFEDALNKNIFNAARIQDYDYFVSVFGKQYWVPFANHWSKINTVDGYGRSQCRSKHETLSGLIRTGTVRCKEFSNGTLKFEQGNVDLTGESPEDRHARLRNALRFAIRAQDLQAMVELHLAISRLREEESFTDSMKQKKEIESECSKDRASGDRAVADFEHAVFMALSGQLDTLHRKVPAIKYADDEAAKEGADRAGEAAGFERKERAERAKSKVILGLDEDEGDVQFEIVDEGGKERSASDESSKVKSPAMKRR